MLEFSYSAVERALAAIYGANDDAVRESAFRARINSFQRLNVLGADVRVGKGQRITYTVEKIERWLCCFELCELGVSPTVAGKLVVHFWPNKFAPIFRAAQRMVEYDPSSNDVVVYLGGTTLMSGSWSSEANFPGVPNINSCALGKLPGHVNAWMAMEPNDPGALPPRMLIVNLSARLRQFHSALAKTYREELIAERRAVTTVAPMRAPVRRGGGGKRKSKRS